MMYEFTVEMEKKIEDFKYQNALTAKDMVKKLGINECTYYDVLKKRTISPYIINKFKKIGLQLL